MDMIGLCRILIYVVATICSRFVLFWRLSFSAVQLGKCFYTRKWLSELQWEEWFEMRVVIYFGISEEEFEGKSNWLEELQK